MSYQKLFTTLLSDASYQHEQDLLNIHELIVEMINELVPPMIEQYWKEHIELPTVNAITLLNGKQTDLTGLRADIEKLILKELSR